MEARQEEFNGRGSAPNENQKNGGSVERGDENVVKLGLRLLSEPMQKRKQDILDGPARGDPDAEKRRDREPKRHRSSRAHGVQPPLLAGGARRCDPPRKKPTLFAIL